MNKKTFLITFFIAVTASIVYFAFKYTQSQTVLVYDKRLVDISLKVEAPFSTAGLTIQENGVMFYSAQQRGNEMIQDSGSVSKTRVNELSKLIEKSDFINMNNSIKQTTDPMDGSTYIISVRSLPKKNPELAFPETYSVSCYEFSCGHNFLKLKDKIIEIWGKDILEVGI